jgi:hypothetical protein
MAASTAADSRIPAAHSVLATVPFGLTLVLLAAYFPLYVTSPADYFGLAPLVVFSVGITAGLGVGWRLGFPTWSLSFLGMLPYAARIAIVLASSSRSSTYGLVAIFPLLALSATLLLCLATSARSLVVLVRGIWDDWTRLSFCLFCWFAFDNIAPAVLFWLAGDFYFAPSSPFAYASSLFTGLIVACAAACAYVYTIGQTSRVRKLTLFAGAVAIATIFTVGLTLSLAINLPSWREGLGSQVSSLAGGLGLLPINLATALAIVFCPAVLGWVRSRLNHRRAERMKRTM